MYVNQLINNYVTDTLHKKIGNQADTALCSTIFFEDMDLVFSCMCCKSGTIESQH